MNKYTAKLTQILTKNLYKRPVFSAIREVIANAIDAHKAVNKPLNEISIFTDYEGNLHVRDFGPGLSFEDIKTIYTVFFETTKSDKSKIAYIGNFGLGAKAPFAYTDSFTIKSHHNGVLSTYIAYNDSGVLKLQKVSDQPTDETGLEVILPIEEKHWEDVYEAIAKISYAQKFYPKLNDYLDKPVRNQLRNLIKTFDEAVHVIEDELNDVKFTAYVLVDTPYLRDPTTIVSGCTVEFYPNYFDPYSAPIAYLEGNFPVNSSRESVVTESIEEFFKAFYQKYSHLFEQKQLENRKKVTKTRDVDNDINVRCYYQNIQKTFRSSKSLKKFLKSESINTIVVLPYMYDKKFKIDVLKYALDDVVFLVDEYGLNRILSDVEIQEKVVEVNSQDKFIDLLLSFIPKLKLPEWEPVKLHVPVDYINLLMETLYRDNNSNIKYFVELFDKIVQLYDKYCESLPTDIKYLQTRLNEYKKLAESIDKDAESMLSDSDVNEFRLRVTSL